MEQIISQTCTPVLMAADRHSNGDVAAVPLVLDSPCAVSSPQPLTVGVPLPRETLNEAEGLVLGDATVQATPLDRWPDGSIRWLLLDFVLRDLPAGQTTRWLRASGNRNGHPARLNIREDGDSLHIDTGAATFHVTRRSGLSESRIAFTDRRGKERLPRIEQMTLESRGPVRCCVRLEGSFAGTGCRFVARYCFFAGTGLVRLRLTVHNPNRARHRGGIWDLGDPGSILFRDLSVEARLPEAERLHWSLEPGQPLQAANSAAVEIYQDSSGGENWQSRNHVNRAGVVPCRFRGYRIRLGSEERFGLRASPILRLEGTKRSVTAAVPEFWQQFPKAMEAAKGVLRVRLFPGQFGDLFELQGGEQKSHTIWLHFGEADSVSPLDWVHRPAVAHASPEWYSACDGIPYLLPAEDGGRLESYLQEGVQGENSFFARREVIDEYGWRNYGEIWADHEGLYYDGPNPVISHYNNQYDMIHGFALQYYRTGDRRWLELLEPLARHVIDIDIYHTTRDKAAYNGGLFWFTDHYKDAARCTHRSYSEANRPSPNTPYGGGPGSEHNFTTGLLHYYYLSGDPSAREAVLSLADWVVNMDDGRRNILGWIDSGPTGLASAADSAHWFGPGRGSGLSINALLDGWLLSGRESYRNKAEELIRRAVHPTDDIDALDLLDVEKHWSYTIFLSILGRYLQVKSQAEQHDAAYAYGRACLLHYAGWMLEHERPYYDHPEKLEFPTATWAVQDLRKANVLRLAASQAAEPLRSRLWHRGLELADRAWADLERFPTRTLARVMAIVLVEGVLDSFCRRRAALSHTPEQQTVDFGKPTAFVPQKTRIHAQFKSIAGLLRAALGPIGRKWN